MYWGFIALYVIHDSGIFDNVVSLHYQMHTCLGNEKTVQILCNVITNHRSLMK